MSGGPALTSGGAGWTRVKSRFASLLPRDGIIPLRLCASFYILMGRKISKQATTGQHLYFNEVERVLGITSQAREPAHLVVLSMN